LLRKLPTKLLWRFVPILGENSRLQKNIIPTSGFTATCTSQQIISLAKPTLSATRAAIPGNFVMVLTRGWWWRCESNFGEKNN